jgi:hypothetical protein
MPEAPVDEDSDLGAGEHKVGFPSSHLGQRSEVNAVPETRRVNQASDGHFRSGVAPAIPTHRLAYSWRGCPADFGSRLRHLLIVAPSSSTTRDHLQRPSTQRTSRPVRCGSKNPL